MLAAQDGDAGNDADSGQRKHAKLKIRNFDHLEFDTVTGTYLGIASFYTKDSKVVIGNTKTGQEAVTTEIRLLIGGESFQAGVVIPYHATSRKAVAADNIIGGQDDVGDVRTHLKFVPLRHELFDLGGGLMLTFPGGGSEVGISSGSVEVLPFVTGTAHAGPVDVNAHVGFNYVNHRDPANGSAESVLYGGSVTMPVLETLGLRLELAGQQFTGGGGLNVIAIEPGLDFMVPCGPIDLMLSASAGYGLAGGAAGSNGKFGSQWGLNTKSGLSRGEWGAGMALGVVWD